MIGALKHRAVIEAQTLSGDGGGGYTATWDAVVNAWVSIEPLGGTDALGADRWQARVRHRIRLRRVGGIAAGMRLRTATRIFAIHDVLDAGAPDPLMILLCEETP